MMDYVAATTPPAGGVDTERLSLPAYDGATLEATWYRRSTGEQPGSAVLFIHGGGMIFGLEHVGAMCDLTVCGYVAASGVPMLVVDYRVAPEHPHPTPVEDCYTALRWLAEHASTLGFDPARLAVMGESAGGGLAAGVCLMARDRGGPAIAQQLLIYPMLDDRPSPPDPALLPFLTWTYDDNLTGWGALLGDKAGGRTSRTTRHPPARPTWPGYPTPTSTSATWTSSATRTSPTHAGCPVPACSPNCICIPVVRTSSNRWHPRPMWRCARSATESGAFAPFNADWTRALVGLLPPSGFRPPRPP